MGFILIGKCRACAKNTEELTFDVDSNPCFCQHCASIQTVAPVRFKYELQPCPKCGSTLTKNDELSSKSPALCPWCHEIALHWEELGHALLIHEFPRPRKNDIIQGMIRTRAGNMQKPMVAIANASYLNGKIVAGTIPPEGTIVECAVIEAGPKTVDLEILRIL